jgi:hypothetical protein
MKTDTLIACDTDKKENGIRDNATIRETKMKMVYELNILSPPRNEISGMIGLLWCVSWGAGGRSNYKRDILR